MAKLFWKENHRAIDQASCGSRAKNKRFTGQLDKQVPSEGRITPLAKAKDTCVVSKAVNKALLTESEQKLC